MRFLIFTLCIVLLSFDLSAQTDKLTFAVVTDIHIGRSQSVESAISTINDINNNPEIRFVLVTGDLTNNGSDEQLYKVKELLDHLNKKYYVIPGNHEDVWSPSGGTMFTKVFGTDRFKFEDAGYCFIGTDCGPMLRHGLAHIPKDNLIWMDSVLNNLKNKNMPVIFANHYPMGSEVDNNFEVIKILKKYNTQLIICGHGHRNMKLNFSGIPGVMCRTNLPVNNQSGYNIVKIDNGNVTFSEKVPQKNILLPSWASVVLKDINKDSIKVVTPDYSVNDQYKNIKLKWEYEYKYDICGGFAVAKDVIYTGTSDGYLLALKRSTGKKLWSYFAGGRIYSTPAISGNHIIFTSTNGNVYCISPKKELIWTFKSEKAIVSSPLVKGNKVFVGFSDGSFRCLDLEKGTVIWDFNEVKNGFVQSSVLYKGDVYFGAWNSNIYALDQLTGKLKWSWSNKRSVIYSPASVPPIAANNHIYTVTPDHYITCFDAGAGNIIWRETRTDMPVWFSDGLSADSSILFVKARSNKGFGISTAADSMKIVWEASLNLDDDSSPTVIDEKENIVYISSKTGKIIAVSRKTSRALWEYKITNSPINRVFAVNANEIYASATDGKIVCLKIK